MLAGLLVVAILLGAAAAPAARTSAAGGAIRLGVFTSGAPQDREALESYAEMVGRRPDIVMWYRGFGSPLMTSKEISNLRSTGQTPMVTWEPYVQSLAQIAAGDFDQYLHEAAATARSWGSPLMVRFAHEMNGDWYPWSASGVSPETYVAAWQHIVTIFRSDGASNVSWVWSPYVEVRGRYPMEPYFPGDAWVDYVGLDGYNWGAPKGRWQSLEAVFSDSYAVAAMLSDRPMILAETASSESGGNKAVWIRTGFMATIPVLFPRVEAVVWFDRAREDDWRIDSSPSSLDAYRAVVGCSLYGGGGPCDPGHPGRMKIRRRPPRCSLRVTRRVPPSIRGAVSYCVTRGALARIVIQGQAPRRRVASLVHRSHPGRNRVPLGRILGRRRLRPGPYRVVVTLRRRDGRSRARLAHFRIVSGRALYISPRMARTWGGSSW
jgi:hypothetical protein